MFNHETLSKKYSVRRLTKEDSEMILELCKSNPLFYRHCPPSPTLESIHDDMSALPPDKNLKDKYYIGFFDGSILLAIMDIIVDYPEDKTVFWGLFMINSRFSGKGIGSSLVKECLDSIKEQEFSSVLLGYMKTNPQSKAFWEKCDFRPTGTETDNGQGIVVVMKKELN